jgi:hypothetical protein
MRYLPLWFLQTFLKISLTGNGNSDAIHYDTYKKTPTKRNAEIFINPQIHTTQKKHYKRNIYGT